MAGVTIVVPVYGDWESLLCNITSLKQTVQEQDNRVIFVNDCGPQADWLEKKILARISGWGQAQYFRNDINIGFVQTCNRAVLEIDKTENNILLLNSDTVVTPDFHNSLNRILLDNPRIASVSPRSNNATVFSVPLKATEIDDYPIADSALIYSIIRDELPLYYESPTTHGFCMLVRRDVINEIGLFDEIYGKGYGEENDFCMRARSKGYINVIANKVFVYHLGSRSFTSEGRKRQIGVNEKILTSRYPDYTQLVGDYIATIAFKERDATAAALRRVFHDDVRRELL